MDPGKYNILNDFISNYYKTLKLAYQAQTSSFNTHLQTLRHHVFLSKQFNIQLLVLTFNNLHLFPTVQDQVTSKNFTTDLVITSSVIFILLESANNGMFSQSLTLLYQFQPSTTKSSLISWTTL